MEDGTPYPYYCGPVDNGYKLKITGENMAQQTDISKMETTQTAVEWLEEELADNLKVIILNNDYTLMEKLFAKAKAMEKEQIIQSSQKSYLAGQEYYMLNGLSKQFSEEYYNKTYNK